MKKDEPMEKQQHEEVFHRWLRKYSVAQRPRGMLIMYGGCMLARVIAALLLVLNTVPALADDCSSYQIGNEYTVLDASTIYMTGMENGIFGKHSNRRKISVSVDESFKITGIIPNTGCYLAEIGYREVSYMCSSLDSDLRFHNVAPKPLLDKIKAEVGRELWVTHAFNNFYTNSISRQNYRVDKSQVARIQAWELGYTGERVDYASERAYYYVVKLDNGSKAYVTVNDYNKAITNGEILSNLLEVSAAKAKFEAEEQQRLEAQRLESERLEREAKIAADKAKKEAQEGDQKERAEVIATFKKFGIVEGKTFWLKYPDFKMPGLARLKIEKINVEFKRDNSYWSDKLDRRREIFLTVDTDYKGIDKIDLYMDPEDFAEVLYKKNIGQKWSKKVLAAIEKQNISMGMTEKQVLASWGRPSNINRTVGPWGVHEQWVYSGSYLYFENGRLTSWQD